MTGVPDKAKMRAEYLRKKTAGYCWAATGALIAVFFGSILSKKLFNYFMFGSVSGIHSCLTTPWSALLEVVVTLGGLAIFGYKLFRSSATKVKTLAYVPSVREQIAFLSAAEILVRGATQPAAANDELLRAADKGTETAAGELLRPIAGEKP